MRVVAGELRGRRLTAPAGGATRPTTDRVREAVFGALVSLDVLEGASVADLYAGSGAMGIEALSRGARHCTFVERDRAALVAIEDNVARFDLGDRVTILTADAVAAAGRLVVDVAFADPPYGFDGWLRLLAVVRAPLVVAEADAALDAPDGWTQGRTKRYGRTWVTFLHRTAAALP